MRIPKEIVLIPESAVAEFLADHERVPEKNQVTEGPRRMVRCRRCGAQIEKFSLWPWRVT